MRRSIRIRYAIQEPERLHGSTTAAYLSKGLLLGAELRESRLRLGLKVKGAFARQRMCRAYMSYA